MENDSGELHRILSNISTRNRFNDFKPQNAARCEPLNVGVCGWFRGDLTQFLHNSERYLFVYAVMRVGTAAGQQPRLHCVAIANRARISWWAARSSNEASVISTITRRIVPVNANGD